MGLFPFLMLYIFFNFCSDMLTCLIYIMVVFLMIKITKKLWIIIIEILLPLTNNNPNRHWTFHAPSDSSITSLSPFSPFRLFPTSIHSLHWFYCVKQEVRLSTGEYTHGCDLQKTTCILARRVSDCDCPQQLTS